MIWWFIAKWTFCRGGSNFLKAINIEVQRRCSAKTQCRKFETNIRRKGIAWPQSQFLYSCVCERFIHSHNRSDYSAAGTWEYINGSQTHECRNRDWGRAIPRKGIHKGDFCCSVLSKQKSLCIFSKAKFLIHFLFTYLQKIPASLHELC